jgi:hypothetical protein
VLLLPSLAPWQATAVQVSSPALIAARTPLVGWNAGRADLAADCRVAIVYRRRAEQAVWEPIVDGCKVLDEYQIQGVWLTRVIELSAPPGRQR